MLNADVRNYIDQLDDESKKICNRLQAEIMAGLAGADNKVWHAHPVWFLDGNPIVGYSKRKKGVQLMFWSGADFDEAGLLPGSGKFKDASIIYQSVNEINADDIQRWLEKSKSIQWDYKHIVKNKGLLGKLEI